MADFQVAEIPTYPKNVKSFFSDLFFLSNIFALLKGYFITMLASGCIYNFPKLDFYRILRNCIQF